MDESASQGLTVLNILNGDIFRFLFDREFFLASWSIGLGVSCARKNLLKDVFEDINS